MNIWRGNLIGSQFRCLVAFVWDGLISLVTCYGNTANRILKLPIDVYVHSVLQIISECVCGVCLLCGKYVCDFQ